MIDFWKCYEPACQEFDVKRPCDGRQEYIFIDEGGRDVKVCKHHARRSYQWPGRHQCEVNDLVNGKCPQAGSRIYITTEGIEKVLCATHYAFMAMLIQADENGAQAQGGAA